MKLYFVRHGQTHWNDGFNEKDMTYKGIALSKDYNPLKFPECMQMNEQGHNQAKKAAEILFRTVKEPRIYCSCMERAIHTAEYTEKKLGIKATQDSRLNEYEMAIGSESKEQAIVRANDFIKYLRRLNDAPTILFAHAKIIRCFFKGELNEQVDSIKNCDIIEALITSDNVDFVRRMGIN